MKRFADARLSGCQLRHTALRRALTGIVMVRSERAIIDLAPSLIVREFDMYRPILAIAFVALGISVSTFASAADWPSKPVRIISPTSPGGASDTFARILAEGF